MTALDGIRPVVRRFAHPAVPVGLVAVVAGVAVWSSTAGIGSLVAWVVLALAAGYAISGSV